MKSLIPMLFMAFVMSQTLHAQKIDADKVPAPVVTAFMAKFPGATKISWEKESANEYEATFHFNSEEVSSTWDPTGKWMETEIDIDEDHLPAAVKSAVHADFPGYKFKDASKNESVQYGNSFDATIEKGDDIYDLVYSAAGKLLSKTKVEKKGDKD